MGYHVSSILAVSPNDTHGYFIYYVPRSSYDESNDWVTKWVEQSFLEIAEQVGPDGVIIAPTPKHDGDYLASLIGLGPHFSFEGAFKVFNHGEEDREPAFYAIHYGGPCLVVSRTPLQTFTPNDDAVVFWLSKCSDETELTSLFSTLSLAIKSDAWDVIMQESNGLAKKPVRDAERERNYDKIVIDRGLKRTLDKMASSTIESVRGFDEERANVLFLAANPTSTSPLSLDVEFRTIEDVLRSSEFRDCFKVDSRWALRVSDVQAALLRFKPKIVHFSGHGTRAGSLVLLDDDGGYWSRDQTPVSPEALSDLFRILNDSIQCVVLNCCYSSAQAEAIAQHVNCVIGMSAAIGDRAAISFSGAFYQAIGYGRDVQTAFDLACNQIDLHGLGDEDIPKLICNKGEASTLSFTPSTAT